MALITNGESGSSVRTKLNEALTLTQAITASAAELNILDGATLTVTELNYVDGVTSAIQTQLNNKEPLKGADDNYVTDAQLIVIGNTSGTNTGDNAVNSTYANAKTVTDFITITQAVNLDTIESDTATNNAKVSNATHTGDVTGSTVLTIATGAVDIAMLSATGTPSAATFLRGDNSWATPSGSGDVSKVGTPADNQIGVWTGDGTIEGTSGLTYNGSNFLLTGDIGSTGSRITKGWFTDLQVTNAIAASITGNAATVTTNANLTGVVTSTGNATAIADAALSIGKTSGLQAALDAKGAIAGQVWTGVHDYGGATSLEIPNANATVGATNGLIAIDTTVADLSHGLLEYYSGEVMGVVAMPIAQYTTPVNGYVVAYNATNDEFELVAQSGGGSSVFSDLVAATGTNTINNVDYTQTWGWDALDTETGLQLNAAAITTGTVLAVNAGSTLTTGKIASFQVNAVEQAGFYSNSFRIKDGNSISFESGTSLSYAIQKNGTQLRFWTIGFAWYMTSTVFGSVSGSGAMSTQTSTAAAPSFYPQLAGSNTGIYGISSGVLGITASGSKQIEISNTLVTFTNAIKTGAPGGAAGEWKLGIVTSGAVTLDTSNYIEVSIGGTVRKLLIST